MDKEPAEIPSEKDEEALRDYYSQFNISLSNVRDYMPYRFVRLHPAFSREETLEMLKKEFPSDSNYPILVPWIDPSFGFYALPGDFRLNQSPCYQNGRIYGQDVSSGAAVAALLSDYHDRKTTKSEKKKSEGWRVLDMCTAPGIKLCCIADWLRQQTTDSDDAASNVVVGVDCSEHRLATCRKIIEKYQIEPFISDRELPSAARPQGYSARSDQCGVRIRLYQNDGTEFGREEKPNLIFDSEIAIQQRIKLGKRKRRNKKTRYFERKLLRGLDAVDERTQSRRDGELPKESHHEILHFDRVLVDAECSTDGSLKHVQERFGKEQGETPKPLTNTQLTNHDELADLVELQRRLAATGFRLLKNNGLMVYSTCSLCEEQNEGVVRWLLTQYPSASVVPLDFSAFDPSESSSDSPQTIKEGSIPGTMRFFPSLVDSKVPVPASRAPNGQYVFGGGFFLAKIVKSE